ncbi:MAG: anti-sigma factor [Betaproteobacteria bacterium]
MKTPRTTDDDVHAWADGQLPDERRHAFEQAMAHDAALAARGAETLRQNAWLRGGLDEMLHEPLPPRLVDAARPPSRAARARGAFAAAAAVVLLGIGVTAGWLARDAALERAGTPTTFARQAALTHALYAADANRPVEVWANEEKRLVTWLTRRLGFPVRAPDLNSVGYALVGGRLVAGNEQPTALFMYENAAKQRLTLQARRQPAGARETAFRYAVEDGVGVYYWVDDQSGYALSGTLDRAELLAIGRLVYGELAAASAAIRNDDWRARVIVPMLETCGTAPRPVSGVRHGVVSW